MKEILYKIYLKWKKPLLEKLKKGKKCNLANQDVDSVKKIKSKIFKIPSIYLHKERDKLILETNASKNNWEQY